MRSGSHLSRVSSCLRAAARVSGARSGARTSMRWLAPGECGLERACRPYALPICRARSDRATSLPLARRAARHRRGGARSSDAARMMTGALPREPLSRTHTLLSAATAPLRTLRVAGGAAASSASTASSAAALGASRCARWRDAAPPPRGRCRCSRAAAAPGSLSSIPGRGARRSAALPVTWHTPAVWRRARGSQQLGS
jgi:hypothetical protein